MSPLAGGTYSAQLIPAISALLAEAALAKGAIDLLAVASGPGSFTGLRVALSTVKGLAEALGKPIVAVSQLAATAAAALADGFRACRAGCATGRGLCRRIPGHLQRNAFGAESASHRRSSAEPGELHQLAGGAHLGAVDLHPGCKCGDGITPGRLFRGNGSSPGGGCHCPARRGSIPPGADRIVRGAGRELPAPLRRGNIFRSQASAATRAS